MPDTQFGIPSAMSVHSSNPSSCEGCVRKRREGHRNAREAKYCPRHQCKSTDISGVMCTTRKKAAEARCPIHTQCKASDCRDPRTLDTRGILAEYCINHTCLVVDCDEGRAHDPARGTYDDLCATHLANICKAPGCNDWKSVNGNFCFQHTCVIEHCRKKSLNQEGRPFCTEHNTCNVAGCQKPRCQFGSQFEKMCRDHYVPPCILESCSNKASSSTRFCNLHACRYTDRKRCEKEARPGRGKPFCADHKCSDHDCQTLRNFSEVEGALVMNSFCPRHECKQRDCVKHNVPDKSYCNSHCCTIEGCNQSRDDDPRFGTLCYTHHEERIAQRAVDERLAERLAEVRLTEERETRARTARAAEEARRRARRQEEEVARADEEARRQARRQQEEAARDEEARRQARRREEEIREREERLRRQQAAEAARRPDPRRTRSPLRRPYGEGLRPGQAYNGYEDEGYRSHRSSGGSFQTEDGW